MITFTQRIAPTPAERSVGDAAGPDEESLWRHLVAAVLRTRQDSLDFEPASPPIAVDHQRQVQARGERVLEHVHLDAESRRMVVTRLSGHERGCLSYEISTSHNGQELVVTACLAVEGIRPGSPAEQHFAEWCAAEQYAFTRSIVSNAARVSAQLAALR